MALAEFAFYIRIVPPLMVAWLAWVVARAPVQERANRVFALFLTVVATAFLLEFLWFTLRVEDVPAAAFARRTQHLLGLVDPPLLLAAVLLYIGKDRLAKSPWLWLGYGAAALVLVALGTVEGGPWSDGLEQRFELGYVNGTYIAGFLLLLLAYARERRPFRLVQFRFLAMGVGFVALSRTGALFAPGGLYQSRVALPVGVLLSFIFTLVLLALIHTLARALHRPGARPLAGAARDTALLLGVFYLLYFLAAVLHTGDMGVGKVVFDAFFPLRWLIFALIVGYGILRYQLFDFDLRVRQTIGLGLALVVGVFLGMVFAAAVYALDPSAPERATPGVRLLGIGVGLLLIPPIWWATAAFVRRLWPESDSVVNYRRRRLEIYQATLESAFRKPEWGAEERRFVETLREVFEVTDDEHEAVIRGLHTGEKATR